MLFEGVSQKHAQRMCKLLLNDDNSVLHYYLENKNVIQKTVFNHSYFGFQFWKVLSENIKKSHSTLSIILRKQYKSSDEVFNYIKNAYSTEKDLYSIVMGGPVEFRDYIKEVNRFLILPVLFRHHIYSPLMVLAICIDLIHHMCGTYIDPELSGKGKALIANYMKITPQGIKDVTWLDSFDKEVLSDELQIHSKIRCNI